MKKISIILIFFCIICFFYINNRKPYCILNDQFCISDFKYSESVEKKLYINNMELNEDEKLVWINSNQIYPANVNGYWNECKEVSKNSVICSFQALVNIPKCISLHVDKYPLKNWNLKFYTITLIDETKYTYRIENYDGPNIPWMKDQSINANQEVLCDPEG